jgi:hypothetical protein
MFLEVYWGKVLLKDSIYGEKEEGEHIKNRMV